MTMTEALCLLAVIWAATAWLVALYLLGCWVVKRSAR